MILETYSRFNNLVRGLFASCSNIKDLSLDDFFNIFVTPLNKDSVLVSDSGKPLSTTIILNVIMTIYQNEKYSKQLFWNIDKEYGNPVLLMVLNQSLMTKQLIPALEKVIISLNIEYSNNHIGERDEIPQHVKNLSEKYLSKTIDVLSNQHNLNNGLHLAAVLAKCKDNPNIIEIMPIECYIRLHKRIMTLQPVATPEMKLKFNEFNLFVLRNHFFYNFEKSLIILENFTYNELASNIFNKLIFNGPSVLMGGGHIDGLFFEAITKELRTITNNFPEKNIYQDLINHAENPNQDFNTQKSIIKNYIIGLIQHEILHNGSSIKKENCKLIGKLHAEYAGKTPDKYMNIYFTSIRADLMDIYYFNQNEITKMKKNELPIELFIDEKPTEMIINRLKNISNICLINNIKNHLNIFNPTMENNTPKPLDSDFYIIPSKKTYNFGTNLRLSINNPGDDASVYIESLHALTKELKKRNSLEFNPHELELIATPCYNIRNILQSEEDKYLQNKHTKVTHRDRQDTIILLTQLQEIILEKQN
jgi:hypothetical protein